MCFAISIYVYQSKNPQVYMALGELNKSTCSDLRTAGDNSIEGAAVLSREMVPASASIYEAG